MSTTEHVELRVPVFPSKSGVKSEFETTPAKMRDELHTSSTYESIFAHQHFPIMPQGVTATALPSSLWTDDLKREDARQLWLAHLADGHYAPFEDTRSILERHGEAHYTRGLGIFGIAHNPLDSVVDFCVPIQEYNMLMHYVAVVALQYYLIKRGCFARVRTDAEAEHFSDALPPYIFAVFRETDCRVPKSTTANAKTEPQEQITHENAESLAKSISFPSFLLLILRWMLRTYPSTQGASVDNTCSEDDDAAAAAASSQPHARDNFYQFCATKISKNFIQSLTCMRFREFIPDGFCERIGDSRGGGPAVTPRLKPCKFFQHPNACQMLSVDAASVRPANTLDRIPYFFMHNFFRPDTAVLIEKPSDVSEEVPLMDRQRQLIWKLLLFSPILSFLKQAHPKITQAWTAARTPGKVFPTDCMQKWAEYDGYIYSARANYSFYVPLANRATEAFVMINNLHLPYDVASVCDDTNMRSMSPEAFDWCRNHGTVHEVLPPRSPVKKEGWNMFFDWVVDEAHRVERTPGARHTPYVLMLAVQLLTGREEDGIATAARLFTLHQLQQSYEEMCHNARTDTILQSINDPAMAEQLNRARLVTWDRCSSMPFPEDKLRHSLMRDRLWFFHFPVSHVYLRMGTHEVVPWVTQFREKNKLSHTLEQLAHIANIFDSTSIRELMNSSSAEAVLTPTQLHQLRVLMVNFTPAGSEIHRALRRVCSGDTFREEVDKAAAASKAKIATFPLAFQKVMEEGRRLIHFDVATFHGQVRAETSLHTERLFVLAIGDPDQISICGSAMYDPYRIIVEDTHRRLQQQQ